MLTAMATVLTSMRTKGCCRGSLGVLSLVLFPCSEKGVFRKRDRFKNVNTFRDTIDFRDSRDSQEFPEC